MADDSLSPSLFDAPHARWSDPSTSRIAAESITLEKLSEVQARVLSVIRISGPMTDEELEDRYRELWPNSASPQSIRTRRSELARKGLVTRLQRLDETSDPLVKNRECLEVFSHSSAEGKLHRSFAHLLPPDLRNEEFDGLLPGSPPRNSKSPLEEGVSIVRYRLHPLCPATFEEPHPENNRPGEGGKFRRRETGRAPASRHTPASFPCFLISRKGAENALHRGDQTPQRRRTRR